MPSSALTLERPQTDPAAYEREALFGEALEARPDYQKEKLEAVLSETLAALSEKEMAPDFSLNFSYGYRWDLTDLWSANVSVTLPLHRDIRERQQVIEHKAKARMNQFELQAIERRVRSEINSITTKIKLLNKQIRAFDEELLPSIDVSLTALEAGFEANREPITDVLIMFTRRINTSLEKISIEERRALAVVRLDGVAGRIYPGGKE
jgi:outer membrane protein TolC